MAAFVPQELGWRPDLPDPRDYTPDHEAVRELLGPLKRRGALPKQVDWREYLPPLCGCSASAGLPQGGSAACACAVLIQYFQRRASGEVLEPSRRFVDWIARRLTCRTGHGEAGLRATWKGIVRFGLPREQDWPEAAAEPDAFAFAAARKFPGLAYVRLDGGGRSGEAVLAGVKAFLAAGFPSVFGFPVSTSLSGEADIPHPTVFDAVRGGQAVMAVGYDDQRRIRSCRGALLIASSWGPAWGAEGFGWLPYSYVLERLAQDFWTLVQGEWLASGEFERPGGREA